MEHNENKIQERIQKELESNGFTEDDLTPEEMAELRSEVEAKMNGETVFDGVLFYKNRYDPDLSRNKK